MNRVFFAALVMMFTFTACKRGGSKPASNETTNEGNSAMAMVLTSAAFNDGSVIPKEYSCDGASLSPPLAWSGVPVGAKSLALICDDPDAPRGTFTHWVVWGLSPKSKGLEEGTRPDMRLAGGAQQGMNSAHRLGYTPPCPPPGKPHRYFFKLYALDDSISVPEGADQDALERAMEGHVLDVVQLMGRYGRGRM